MFGSDLLKHLNEFRRYIRNFKYEVSPQGIYFPRAHALCRGLYEHWVTGYESELALDHNIIPDQGLNHMLDVVCYTAGSQTTIGNWYLALHSGTGTPDATLTAANYNSTLNEITSGSEGYSEATRVEWVADTVDTTNTEIINDAAPSAFTIVTASSLAVNGAAILSASAKGSTSGYCLSGGKFSATRNLANTDVFNLKYKVDLDAV